MGRRVEALRKSWCIWTVLFFSIGVKSLVNQVEGPFSRSLVTCDVPLRRDAYTGSRWCGDRLTVIQGGVEIQSRGQSQENLAMLLSLTFLVVLTGVLGAKVTLVLGLFAVTTSVALFVLACSSPKLGRSLYALAQGLQGVYPIEYLQGIIMMHLSFKGDMDPHAVFELGSYMGIVSNFFWNLALGGIVNMLELNDYTRVWTGILAMNSTILVMAIVGFPAMMPPDAADTIEQGPLSRLLRELANYRDLLWDWRARRMMFKLFFENMQSPFFGVSSPAMLMAYHGWSQYQVVWFYTIKDLVGLACIPFFQKGLQRYGHHDVYVWSCRYFELGVLLRALTVHYTDKVVLFLDSASVLMTGFEPFRGFVDSRFMEPDQVQRFQSARWLMGYFQNVWLVPVYAQLFDAYAETYMGRFWPGMLCASALVIHYFLVFHTIYDMDGIHGFGVTVRVLDEGAKKLTQLWEMVAREHRAINHETWQLFNLEAILGLPWELTGGAGVADYGQWVALIETMNMTPMQGHEALKKLDKAIAYAYGVHEQYLRSQATHVERVNVLWDMVAGSDGWVSYEKWQLYKLQDFLGLDWIYTGGQGIFSREQWLGLLDPRKASKESLTKLEYCISYVGGVQRAIAKMVADASAIAAAPPEHAEIVPEEPQAEPQHLGEAQNVEGEAYPRPAEAEPQAEPPALTTDEVVRRLSQQLSRQGSREGSRDGSLQVSRQVSREDATKPADGKAESGLPAVERVPSGQSAGRGPSEKPPEAPAAEADSAAGGRASVPAAEAVAEATAAAKAVRAGAAEASQEGKKDV